MLGYMTKREALANGFTHHGKYYGIPCWIAPDQGFMVATKAWWLEPLMSLFHVLEGLSFMLFYPDEEPVFRFLVGPKIEETL